MLRSTIKLAFATNGIFWKYLLYKVIAVAICLLLLFPVYKSLSVAFMGLGFDFASLMQDVTFFNLSSMLETLNVFMGKLFVAINTLDLFSLMYSLCIIFIVFPFVHSFGDIAMGECLYLHMACYSKSRFTGNLLSKFNSSFLYSFVKTILQLPLVAFFFYIVYKLSFLYAINNFLVLLLIVTIIVFVALYKTIFLNWHSTVSMFKSGVAKSFASSFKNYHNFFKVLAVNLLFAIIAVCIVLLCSLYSLIFVVIALTYAIDVLGMISTFDNYGMNYYLNATMVVVPKKIEQIEGINKTKHLI